MDIEELIRQGTYERDYRKFFSPSSLNPAIGYALNQIAGLDKNDRILDPCCGTATILIERLLQMEAICVGVDIDHRALESAKVNIEAAGISLGTLPGNIELKHGNILEKKFPENYFTKIISNLPFGLHSGSREENIKLYRFLADSSIKWLKVGGKAVFYTQAKAILKNSYEFNPNWKLVEEYPLKVGGLTPSIFVYMRIG